MRKMKRFAFFKILIPTIIFGVCDWFSLPLLLRFVTSRDTFPVGFAGFNDTAMKMFSFSLTLSLSLSLSLVVLVPLSPV